MSNGFDLIRRHIEGLKSSKRGDTAEEAAGSASVGSVFDSDRPSTSGGVRATGGAEERRHGFSHETVATGRAAQRHEAWRAQLQPRVAGTPPPKPIPPIVERPRPEALKQAIRRPHSDFAPDGRAGTPATGPDDAWLAGRVASSAAPPPERPEPFERPAAAPAPAADPSGDIAFGERPPGERSPPARSAPAGPPEGALPATYAARANSPQPGPSSPADQNVNTPQRARQQPAPQQPVAPQSAPVPSTDGSDASRRGGINTGNARAARRHSIFVSLMKGLLPVTALGLVGVFVFYSIDFRKSILPENVEFDPGNVSVESDGVRMVAPRLTGVDDRQQTFEVTAAEAVQSRADLAEVTLQGIDARVNLIEGGIIGFSADHGRYNSDLSQIWLRDNLEVRSSEGYVARLSEAQVDFKNGLMVTNNPVHIFTDRGEIRSQAMQVFDGGDRIRFLGGVTVDLKARDGTSQ